MPRKVNIDGVSEFDLRVAISYTLLVLTLTLKEALAAKERQPEPRKELSQDAIEELNRTIKELALGDIVTIVYYCHYGAEYRQITGALEKVNPLWGFLQVGNVCIDFCEILQVVK